MCAYCVYVELGKRTVCTCSPLWWVGHDIVAASTCKLQVCKAVGVLRDNLSWCHLSHETSHKCFLVCVAG
jgi:hypothetical protein